MGISQQADNREVVVLGWKGQSSYLDGSIPLIKLEEKSGGSLEMDELHAVRLWLSNHHRKKEGEVERRSPKLRKAG